MKIFCRSWKEFTKMLAEVKHSNGSIKLFTCLVLVSLATLESPRKMLPCNVALPQICQHWA